MCFLKSDHMSDSASVIWWCVDAKAQWANWERWQGEMEASLWFVQFEAWALWSGQALSITEASQVLGHPGMAQQMRFLEIPWILCQTEAFCCSQNGSYQCPLEKSVCVTKVIIYRVVCVLWSLPRWFSGEESTCNTRDVSSIPGSKDPLLKEMATHSSLLAWEIPWTGESGRLQSMGSQSRTQLSN